MGQCECMSHMYTYCTRGRHKRASEPLELESDNCELIVLGAKDNSSCLEQGNSTAETPQFPAFMLFVMWECIYV